MARSTRAVTTPKSRAASSERSLNESACSRLASQTVPGRLHCAGGQRPEVVVPDGRRHGVAADPARLAAGLTAAGRLGDRQLGQLADGQGSA
ncbi:MAG: hypothetical protein WKF54_01275 [Nocardioidaceae bacterium]